MSAQITITVRLFAQLRQAAGGQATLERVITDDVPAGAVAAEVLAELGLDGLAGRVVLAIDGDFADPSDRLSDGAWLSLVPPVSGGAAAAGAIVDVRVTEDPLEPGAAMASLADPAAGGTVVFQGTPRDVDALDFEAHHELAALELRRIGERLVAEHGLTGVALHHRCGRVPAGQAALVVVAAAPHRGPAFAAARAALELIKERVPIWKSEVRGETLSAVEGQTVTGLRTVAEHSAPQEAGDTRVLTHVGPDGEARMVDVTGKDVTDRIARATATVVVSPQTARLIADGNGPKGEVIGVARLAGIMAAKQTAAIVPLAHPLPLTKVDVDAGVDTAAGLVQLTSLARTTGRTGVEIEALTAVLVAALTIYDMVKAVERHARIEGVHVTEKRGGRHDFAADGQPPAGVPGATAADQHAAASASSHCGDAPESLTLAAVTVSTTRASGRRADGAAAALGAFARRLGWRVACQTIVTDEPVAISGAIREAAAQPGVDVVLTLGGTGITTDDVTPEATRAVIGREIPGISEAIRAASREVTPLAALSRGVVGEVGGCLVVNLPGSPKALGELEPLLAAILPHAVSQLRRAARAAN